jgi:hypothetical protein
LSLYRDGVFISSQSCVNTVLTVTGAIILGQEQDSVGGGFSASQAFQGGLNDLRLYDEALSTYEIKEISKAKIIHYTFNDPDEEPTINLIPGSNGINSYPNIGNTWGTYYTEQYNDNTYFSIGAIVSVTNNIVTVNGSGRTIYTYDVLRPQTTGGGVTAGTDYFIKMVGVNQFTLHAYNSSQDGSQGYINPATNDHKVFDSISLDQRISINSTNFPTMWWGPPHRPNSALVKEIIPNIVNYAESFNGHSFIRLHFDHKLGAVDGGMAYGVEPLTNAGETYTLSCYVRAVTPETIGKKIYVEMYNWASSTSWGIVIQEYTFTDMEWHRIQGTDTSPGTGYTNGTNAIYFFPSDGSTIDVSEIQLENKSHASSFTTSIRSGYIKDYSEFNNSSLPAQSTSPYWVDDSKLGVYSVDFNGVDQYINIEAIKDIPFNDGVSYAIWTYPTSVKSWARFLDSGVSQQNDNIVFSRYISTNEIYLEIKDGTSNGASIRGGALTLNEWQHVAFTISSTGAAKIYRNGEVVASGTVVVPNIVSRINSFIGRSNWTADSYYDGQFDDVRMYTTVLSDEDIIALYKKRGNFDNKGNVQVNQFIEEIEENLVKSGLVVKLDPRSIPENINQANDSSTVVNNNFEIIDDVLFRSDASPTTGIGTSEFQLSDNVIETGSVTVQWFMKITSNPNVNANNNWRRIIAKDDGTRDPFGFVLEQSLDINFTLQTTLGSKRYINNSFTPYAALLNKWEMHTYTYDKAAGIAACYKNEELILTGPQNSNTSGGGATVPGEAMANLSLATVMEISSNTTSTSGDGCLPADIGVFMIYNRALSEEEVINNYNQLSKRYTDKQLEITSKGQARYIRFAEGSNNSGNVKQIITNNGSLNINGSISEVD